MKIDRLETHDRLQEFHKQNEIISKGCQDCIEKRPKEFGTYPFYIYAHCRTSENGYSKRLIWQPRLRKPKAETNSILVKAYPPSDKIKIIWMIPVRDQWNEYNPDNMLESNITAESIRKFKSIEGRRKLEEKEEDDLSEEEIDRIYREISINENRKKSLDKLYKSSIKQAIEEGFSTS
jgi:hypothetical protein